MLRLFVLLPFVFLSFVANSQSIHRVEVKGVILSNTNDVEAVTVYNKSSNKGTITNVKGEFTIKVAKNDIIEISALQFQILNITIDAEVIKSKQLKIQLVDQVNRLDAVMLTSGLIGILGEDIANVKTVKPIVLDMGNMDVDFEYNDIKAFDQEVVQDHLTSIITPDARKYTPDLLKIFKLFTKSKVNQSLKKDLFVDKQEVKRNDLLDVYTHDYIEETFNISSDNIEAFIAYVETNGIKQEFFKPENEVQLIEYLFKHSELFLKLQDVKD